MNIARKRLLIVIAGVAIAVLVGAGVWQKFGSQARNKALVTGNGRVEATEIDIAAKSPGRVKKITVREGDFVTAGQVVAEMDIATLEAQLRQARAQLQQAESAVSTTRSQLVQRESEKAAALAVVRQRDAELVNAQKHAARTSRLAANEVVSRQSADDDRMRLLSARAAQSAALAQVAAAQANIETARAQIKGARSAVEAAQATVERLQADIEDNTLRSPRDGRVQYRVAEPGEVVGAGGRVLSLVDLSDVYMTFFLPTAMAGRVALGSEVRLILDAAPQYVIPANVSYVADVAQFTPKTVETASEREKLMFRVRAHIPAEILKRYITQVKTGLPGVAYLRQDPAKPWPPQLSVRLP
ncbi:MAG TPA: HlyD family efflux transporter periplasmic adaptor subunit [Geomonas sp.]|nr:HlyD family efflux transporter periplasmic adaptor subunit [Geomonas sp.]